jgi:hypothetical protein
VQHHRFRHRQQRQQDADQDHSPRHPEDAGEKGRADHRQAQQGDEKWAHCAILAR